MAPVLLTLELKVGSINSYLLVYRYVNRAMSML